ncbi:MAG: hypothetical protein HQM14_19680 [SAR324 cluster bacterium]|nr:hypothetical protein [SAR324 cluster bacterium]
MENATLEMALTEAVASGTIRHTDRENIEQLVEQENQKEALDILDDYRTSWEAFLNSTDPDWNREPMKYKTGSFPFADGLDRAIESSWRILEILELQEKILARGWK